MNPELKNRTPRAVGQVDDANGHREPEHERRLAALETDVRVQRSEIARLKERLDQMERRLAL